MRAPQGWRRKSSPRELATHASWVASCIGSDYSYGLVDALLHNNFGLYDLLLLRAARPRPSLTALLYAGRALCQSLFLALTLRQAGHREHLGGLRRYDSYLLLLSLAVLAYTVWPGAIEWKARRYDWVEG